MLLRCHMKNRLILALSFSALLAVSVVGLTSMNRGLAAPVNAADADPIDTYDTAILPKYIDLNDTSSTAIRSYYSSLNSLSNSERQGMNLLKNLKEILRNGQKYYSYDTDNNGRKIWQIYEIADRDWDKSPASEIPGYNSYTNTISNYTYGTSYSNPGTNPYLHSLYVDRTVDNQMRAWKKDNDTYSRNNHGNNAEWYIDREHIWPKSEGFEHTTTGGARGDPMHLWSADSQVNSDIHNNYFYGYVDSISEVGKWSYGVNNYRGTSLTLGGYTNTFEPQDSDKGDIARSIFYMAARYNFISGEDEDGIGPGNPNLSLTQSFSDYSKSGFDSTETIKGFMGILPDLLAWHKADPVDEFEIHRNNLLYTNFTNNRNPFIDFPEWVDYIWGTVDYDGRYMQSYDTTPTGYATPSSDTINGYNPSVLPSVISVSVSPSASELDFNGTDSEQLTATVETVGGASQAVTWSTSNSNVVSVSDSGYITAKSVGSAVITATSTFDNTKYASCSVTVIDSTVHVTSVSLSSSSESLLVGGNVTLYETVLPNNATDKSVNWSSSNTNVATVNDGVVTAVGIGSATITVTTVDGNKTATCAINVTTPVSNTFNLYTGEITEGDYIIYYNGRAMNTTVSNNRLQFLSVTPNNDSIVDPDASIIWHIEKDGDYWTLYNADAGKYASGTSTKNQATMVDEITDYARWRFESGDTFNFINIGRENAIQDFNNKYLRNNGTYGFACYASGTGGLLSLFKKSSSAQVPVTGVSLDEDSYNLLENEQKTIKATISPNNATDKLLIWESDNENIATVNNGFITATGVGTTTITVTTHDGGFSDSAEIVVTARDLSLTKNSPYINGVAYKMFFNSEGNRYFTGQMTGYYGATDSNIENGIDVFFEERTDGQNIRMATGEYIYVVTSGNYINFKCDSFVEPDSPWIYDEDNETLTYSISEVSYSVGSKGTYDTFGAYKIADVEHKVEFIASYEKAAASFSKAVNSNIACYQDGKTTPSFNDFEWTDFENVYSKLNDSGKEVITNADADEKGTIIEQYVARYDYIVGKYHYNDFLNRHPVSIGGRITVENNSIKDSPMMIIVVCSIAITSISFMMLIVIKKKKEK